ncbi:MAG: hypothetical protein ACYS0G_03270 [Planctomycetota bacterium]
MIEAWPRRPEPIRRAILAERFSLQVGEAGEVSNGTRGPLHALLAEEREEALPVLAELEGRHVGRRGLAARRIGP